MTEENIFEEDGQVKDQQQAAPDSEEMDMKASQSYKFDKIAKETEKGICLTMGEKDQWLPKSQVEVNEADSTVSIPNWLAKDNDLL